MAKTREHMQFVGLGTDGRLDKIQFASTRDKRFTAIKPLIQWNFNEHTTQCATCSNNWLPLTERLSTSSTT